MLDYIRKFENIMYIALIILLGGVILFSIADLLWVIWEGLVVNSVFRLDNAELLSIFGVFLLVVIGIELLDTLKAYLRENVIHVEIVILVAVIAIARKVIILDPELRDGALLAGMGILIVGLGIAYYLIKKGNVIKSIPPG
ncbi:MAG: phosphate-starvation-inducible PsiE family protein [Methanoregulaceae archaeon]|nr:phosphate-starvation-inducible PsiE family protein [Methanoregulaceae archaeon]